MLNKVMIIGNLGADPDVRKTQSGDDVATLSIATSESWKDKQGQKQTKTEWHRVVVFGKLATICGQYLKKGSKALFEGQLRTRKWVNKEGKDQYTTEVVVSGFGGNMIMLDSANQGGQTNNGSPPQTSSAPPAVNMADLDDDIPF